jgi:hypothetical protein
MGLSCRSTVGRAARAGNPTKDELVASALWRVGERVDERIRRGTTGGMTLGDLRLAATELLPLDATRREEAARLRVLLDGLRLQLITTPRQTTVKWALTVLDDHLAALADG